MQKSIIYLEIVLSLLFITSGVFANDLQLTSVSYDPAPAYPGSSIDLVVHIYNNSNTVAKNVQVQLNLAENTSYSNFPFSFDKNTDGIEILGTIPAQQTVTVTYRLFIDSQAFDGTYHISIGLKDSDNPYTLSPVSIKVISRKPLISIESVTPVEMFVGKSSELTLAIKNTGSSVAQDVSIGIGEDRTITSTGTVIERSIVPLGSTFTHINSLAPNETILVTIPVLINPGTAPKAYFVPIIFEFFDQNKTKYTDHTSVGLKVSAESGLEITIADVKPAFTVGDKSKITMHISNNGLGVAKAIKVIFNSPVGSIEPTEIYAGIIDPDTVYSVQTDLVIPADTKPGTYNLTAIIHSKDSFGEERTETKTLPFVVRPKEIASLFQPETYTLIYGILGVILIAGIFVLFKDKITALVRGRK